jgi:hypothetical protein
MRNVRKLLSEDTATEREPQSTLLISSPIAAGNNRGGAFGLLIFVPIILIITVLFQHTPACGSAYDFLQLTSSRTLFALDPDITIRRIDPRAPNGAWTLAEGWGLPPLFFRTSVPGLYDRLDLFYPFGCREESKFRSKLRFTPFFESYSSKLPPFDSYSRCLTAFQGVSDMGQPYWGIFPFYGYTFRRGSDKSLFFLFPLYSESTDDDAKTIRLLWPLITVARSPGRSAFKIWPLFGRDSIRKEHRSWFFLWPFFQHLERYPGTPEASSYTSMPFPLYIKQETCFSTTIDVMWPLFTYYHHYKSGHTRYSFRPFFTYGSGGGVDELNIFFVYSSKTDKNKGSSEQGSVKGYISVGDDEVFTERKFLMMSSIQKRYRKGFLVFAKYKFWPFAEYRWDLERGSHLKVPELISLKSDWWDMNLGRLLRFLDLRDTPLTREISLLSGLSQRTEFKSHPHISRPPAPGDDSWAELISGSFGKR